MKTKLPLILITLLCVAAVSPLPFNYVQSNTHTPTAVIYTNKSTPVLNGANAIGFKNTWEASQATSWNRGTNFLTLTNRPWVQIEGALIIRVTDQEWTIITNHYSSKLKTNEVAFWD